MIANQTDPLMLNTSGNLVVNTGTMEDTGTGGGASNRMSFIGGSSTGKLAVDAVGQFGTNVGLATYTGPLLENFGTLNAIDLKNLVLSTATLDFQNSTLHNAAAGVAGFHLGNDGVGDVLLTHN